MSSPAGTPAKHETPASGGKPVQSVERALDILETVVAGGKLGVTEIAAAVGLHVATTHNLLRTLAARRYLTNHAGRYLPGPALVWLAARGGSPLTLAGEVQPALRRLVEATGESASATVLMGTTAKLIAFERGTHPLTVQYPCWEWPEAGGLATGRVLMAYRPESEWDDFAAANDGVAPGWTAADWRREFLAIREAGACAHAAEEKSGTCAVACPVFTADGTVLAAIGATLPTVRVEPGSVAAILRVVRREAAALSRRLGWMGDNGSIAPGS